MTARRHLRQPAQRPQPSSWEAAIRYLPALFRAAGITVLLSVLSMALAVVIGVLIATGRVYGPRPLEIALTAWVELIRGTPLLLQLFVLYFGLAAVVQLPAFLAALLGLGINYAAYESEIYRGALQAVPRGQLEAARTLGFTNVQTLQLVRGSPGVPAGAGADDKRLRRAAEGQLAGLGHHGGRADEADVHLRRQHRQLGAARRDVRRDVPAAVVAARTLREANRERLAPMTPVLEVFDLYVHRDSRPVVQGVTFAAARGERVALMGPSGAGKTTVLRAIAGLEPRMGGAISVCRPDAYGPDLQNPLVASALRRKLQSPGIGMVFQFHHLFEHLTALQNVCLAPVHVSGAPRGEAEAPGTGAPRSPWGGTSQ